MSGTDYFTYSDLVANDLARAGDVNARIAAIQQGFGKLPSPTKIQQGRSTYCADAGAANALVVSLDFAPDAYVAGTELTVKVAVTNTASASININGLGAKTIKRADGSAIQAGDLTAGYIVKLVYDGTNFRLIGASETAASTSATAAAASATAASGYATQAMAYRDTAETHKNSAATSAANAATSETNAAASAASAATAVSGYVAKAGDTMTGALTLSGPPTVDLHAATKKYVDDAVFAAGAYTADGATITLSGGQFSLTTIANLAVLGNVSGAVAKPGALTGTQLATIVDPATTALQGLMSAADKVKLDAITGTNTGDQTSVTGNAGTATALQTARTIAISGAVTGTATSFDGTANITIPISAMDVGAATTGTLAVARGGTGVTTATGTGSVVLSADAALTGAPTAPTAAKATDSTVIATTAYVKNNLADYCGKFASIVSSSSNFTLSDNTHHNALVECTGATTRTITANSTPTAGFYCTIVVTGTAARTFSCAGGVYVDGGTASVTSANIPAGGRATAVHKGGGVWFLMGV